MKFAQLTRFAGLLTAVAFGLIAYPSTKAAEGGPESLVTTPIKALEEKNPKLLWDLLPASYQSDVNSLVQEFAKNMDAELWEAGVGLVRELGELLGAQKDLLANMGAGADPNMDAAEIKQGLDMFAKIIDKFTKSDFGSLDKMKSIDLGNVADTFGKDLLNLAEEAAKLSGELDPFQLEAMKQVKVEVVGQDENQATVKISGLPELDLTELQDGLHGGLPPGIPGLPGGLDGVPIPDFSSFENGEQKLTKVEGKWVPADLAEGWEAGMKEAKQGLSEMGKIPDADKQMALTMIGAFSQALGGMKTAKNEQEFTLAAMGAAGALMGAATEGGGLEGFGAPPAGFGGPPPGFDSSPSGLRGAQGGQSFRQMQIQRKNATLKELNNQLRSAAKGEVTLTNGDQLDGVISDVDRNGIVVRVDVGGFSKRANWMQLSQQSLRKIKKLGEIETQIKQLDSTSSRKFGVRERRRWIGVEDYVEPFIEPTEWEMEKSKNPDPVELKTPTLPATADVSSKMAAYGSPGGIGILVAIAIGSLVAGLGVAAFKESNVALAGVISFVLPIVGPLLLLAKPKVEYEYEGDDEDDAYDYDAEPEAPAGAVMGDTGGGAVVGMMPEAKKMSFAQSGPKKQTGTGEQSWDRDDTRFDRSFFQNNFPNYFKVVLGASERNMVLAIKTGKREYVGQRIKRISGNDMHMELLSGKEQKISFSEIGAVDLRPK